MMRFVSVYPHVTISQIKRQNMASTLQGSRVGLPVVTPRNILPSQSLYLGMWGLDSDQGPQQFWTGCPSSLYHLCVFPAVTTLTRRARIYLNM